MGHELLRDPRAQCEGDPVNGNTFEERLRRIGITTAAEFAEMGEAEAWIRFHPLAPFYAVLYTYAGPARWDEVVYEAGHVMTYDEGELACVGAAQYSPVGATVKSWVYGPFPHTWQTSETRDRVMRYLERREEENGS